jgi:hypothetical protein
MTVDDDMLKAPSNSETTQGSLLEQETNSTPVVISIEIEIVHSEPANWTGSHLSALHPQPYMTYYD